MEFWLQKELSSFGRDQDEVVITPLKMYQRKIQGNLDVSSIIVSVKEDIYIEEAKEQIVSLMQERRAIKIGESDNFHIYTRYERCVKYNN